MLLQRLPWLVFGLYAGALADRVDRRAMVALCDGLRAVVLLLLSITIVTDAVNITVVLVAMFLLGTAEVFADTATRTLLPMLVDRDDLGIGNARLQFGMVCLTSWSAPRSVRSCSLRVRPSRSSPRRLRRPRGRADLADRDCRSPSATTRPRDVRCVPRSVRASAGCSITAPSAPSPW